MRADLLELLRCPFCGGNLRLRDQPQPRERDGEIDSGILQCHCNTYPVAGGIPYIRTTSAAGRAMQSLDRGDPEAALAILLGHDSDASTRAGQQPRGATFREELAKYAPDDEGTYLLYRFSDPGFLSSEVLVHGLGDGDPGLLERILDVGGGSGQLAWSLERRNGTDLFVIADIVFWKLWLAHRYVSPRSAGVCCDANVPLPFARESFSLVHCSDAFHYVWNRRLLAEEMVRGIRSGGIVLLTHLHNAETWNESAGMPLPPEGYRRLFPTVPTRLYGESFLVERFLSGEGIGPEDEQTDERLREEVALTLIGTARDLPAITLSRWQPHRDLRPNPLYERQKSAGSNLWVLWQPSRMYADETMLSREYLVEKFQLTDDELARARRGRVDDRLRDLADRLALLPLPARYM